MKSRNASGKISARVTGLPQIVSTSAGTRHTAATCSMTSTPLPRATTHASTHARTATIPRADGWTGSCDISSRLRHASHRLIGRIRKPWEYAASPDHFWTSDRKLE